MTPEPPRTDRAALRVYQGYRYTIVSIAQRREAASDRPNCGAPRRTSTAIAPLV